MTKEIILTISGLHATDGETDDPVEVITPAEYFFKNGKHYVIYDEVMEGIEGSVKSKIKFTENISHKDFKIFQKEKDNYCAFIFFLSTT